MKALTIKQPLAELICLGIKDIENRQWKTNYRGRILIHASQSIPRKNESVFDIVGGIKQFYSLPGNVQDMVSDNIYTTSAIIGEVDIVDCILTSKSIWALPENWHWVLANPVKYDEPILNVKGKLSFWQYEREVLQIPR